MQKPILSLAPIARAIAMCEAHDNAIALARYRMFVVEQAPCSPTGLFHNVMAVAGYDAMGRAIKDANGKVIRELREVPLSPRQQWKENCRARRSASRKLARSRSILAKRIDKALASHVAQA
jgi:hypothetical protein